MLLALKKLGRNYSTETEKQIKGDVVVSNALEQLAKMIKDDPEKVAGILAKVVCPQHLDLDSPRGNSLKCFLSLKERYKKFDREICKKCWLTEVVK